MNSSDSDADRTPGQGEEPTRPPPETWSAPAKSTGFYHQRLPDEHHPTQIGFYRISRVLGQGGMGVVYLAEQTEPVKRQVALKLIKLGMDTREIVTRFESERQVLAMMNHASIARVHDAGTAEGGRPYFVMEYVEGLPLLEYCERAGLSIRQRLELFVRICAGVQHAHQKAVIHRDLKPSNVLVTLEDGLPVPKIIDFGIAKAIGQRLTEQTLRTQIGQIIGTPEYMSPEQTRSGDLDVDTRTDIYSLGVILYELLTGVRPFDPARLRKSSFTEILRILQEEEPPKPSTRLNRLSSRLAGQDLARAREAQARGKTVRGDLDWITLKALEKDRSRRFASASEMIADIHRTLNHEPVLARPPSTVYRLRKFVRRHRGAVATAVALVVLAMASVAIGFMVNRLELATTIEEANLALDEKDLDTARARLNVVQKSHPGHPEVEALKRRVNDLRLALQTAQAIEVKAEGDREAQAYIGALGSKQQAVSAHRHYQGLSPPWLPPWYRTKELEAWRRIAVSETLEEDHFNKAMLAFSRAQRLAPSNSRAYREISRALEDLLIRRYRDNEEKGEGGHRPGDYYQKRLEELGLDSYRREIEGKGRVLLETDPAGAEVFCFRYENIEERLLPLPFDPRAGYENPEKGLLGKPFLRIDRVWGRDLSPLEPGDRLLEISGRQLRVRGDLADVLEKADKGQAMKVRVRRAGEELDLTWRPFPENWRPPAARWPFVDFYRQLGFTLEGYPLEFPPACRVGVTEKGRALEVELPRGSYLFVLKRSGHVVTRYPVRIPDRHDEVRTIRLPADDEPPPGFVYIPAGLAAVGGDPKAYETLPRRGVDVAGFFMARFEVTFRQYLEFINDPEVSGRFTVDAQRPELHGYGRTEIKDLFTDWNDPKRAGLLASQVDAIYLIPFHNRRPLIVPSGERTWQVNPDLPSIKLDFPVFGVSMIAAVEYASWMTRKKHEGRWRFRLPTDLEWEKAARGVDGRVHVWGNYLLLCYCRSANGAHDRWGGVPGPSAYPTDESVYGVRDLAGSVAEPTSEKARTYLRMFVYRGGSFDATDERDFRIAARNRRLPENSYRFLGIRLVADLPGPAIK